MVGFLGIYILVWSIRTWAARQGALAVCGSQLLTLVELHSF